MKARLYTGGFIDSCNTMKNIDPTKEAVFDYFYTDFIREYKKLTKNDLEFVDYKILDKREPWNDYTVLVCFKEWGPVGYISEKIE